MTREKKLALILIVISTVITILSLSVGFLLDATLLTLATLLFIITLLLSTLSVHVYNAWCLPLMTLTSYAQLLAEGTTNSVPCHNEHSGLLKELTEEINQLSQMSQGNSQLTLSTISLIMDNWEVAVAIFDEESTLIYRNQLMLKALKRPMLIGSKAADCSFIIEPNNQTITHQHFAQHWQTQCVTFNENNTQYQLFSATNISSSLQAHESIIAQNFIRVFSHELRNSLTPMESMTDTLLSFDKLDEQSTRLVLTRINQRSTHLLDFISRYADINRLSAPFLSWFDSQALIDEATTVLNSSYQVNLKGEKKCFGDRSQLSMVLTNLFKNAQQATTENALHIDVNIYQDNQYQGNQYQVVEVLDNGCGFTNVDNLFTPFYSTKEDGSGIGLALCKEIIHLHRGTIDAENRRTTTGAKIMMQWPINHS